MNDSPDSASRSPENETPSPGRVPSPAEPQDAPAQTPPRNWAAQQPPSADGPSWGAPTQRTGGRGGPGGPKGNGGNQGWAAWNQQPTAPKPGVIPLRPLSVSEILNGAVTTLRDQWRTVLGVALGIAVVIQLVSTVTTRLWTPHTGGLDALGQGKAPSTDKVMDQLGAELATLSATLVVQQLGVVLITALLTFVVSRAALGRTSSLAEAWQDSRTRLPRLLGLLVLITALLIGVMCVGFVPGAVLLSVGAEAAGASLLLLGVLGGTGAALWLWARLSLAAPALMLEKQSVFTAMRRSTKLVRGNWWRIFGILLLTQILMAALSSVFQLPASFLSVSGSEGSSLTGLPTTGGWGLLLTSGIGQVLAYTIALPMTAGISVLLYLDQRIRREALDLELARAAGITDYGNNTASHPTPDH